MDYLVRLVLIAVSCALVNNFVLVRFLGICPFLGVSSKIKTAAGMGLAVTFVMGMASLLCWAIYNFLLSPLGIGYLSTIAYILAIAALVQFVEMFLLKYSQPLYKALGVYLPLITTNCAVLGVALINLDQSYDILESFVNGVAGGLGFLFAIVLMAGIRERQEGANIPKALQGFPIALITAGLMSIAFLGFSGLIK